MQINGALQLAYPNQSNASANYCNIFFIFSSRLAVSFYLSSATHNRFAANLAITDSIGFGPCAWIYSSEVSDADIPSFLYAYFTLSWTHFLLLGPAKYS